jgi:hypothetical protein
VIDVLKVKLFRKNIRCPTDIELIIIIGPVLMMIIQDLNSTGSFGLIVSTWTNPLYFFFIKSKGINMVLMPDIVRPYINKSFYFTQILIRVRTDMNKVCTGFVDGNIFISKSLCPEQTIIPIKIFWILFVVEPVSYPRCLKAL